MQSIRFQPVSNLILIPIKAIIPRNHAKMTSILMKLSIDISMPIGMLATSHNTLTMGREYRRNEV